MNTVPHPGAKPKRKATKRTRRAVKGRRTLEQHAAATEKLLTEWEAKLDTAISKVQHYRKELKKTRTQIAKKQGDAAFGEL